MLEIAIYLLPLWCIALVYRHTVFRRRSSIVVLAGSAAWIVFVLVLSGVSVSLTLLCARVEFVWSFVWIIR